MLNSLSCDKLNYLQCAYYFMICFSFTNIHVDLWSVTNIHFRFFLISSVCKQISDIFWPLICSYLKLFHICCLKVFYRLEVLYSDTKKWKSYQYHYFQISITICIPAGYFIFKGLHWRYKRKGSRNIEKFLNHNSRNTVNVYEIDDIIITIPYNFPLGNNSVACVVPGL